MTYCETSRCGEAGLGLVQLAAKDLDKDSIWTTKHTARAAVV